MVEPEASPAPEAAPAGPPPRRGGLRPEVTATLALLTVATVLAFYYEWGSPLGILREPDRSLERLVSREMDFREGLEAAAPWERRLYALLGVGPEPLEGLIARYDDLAEEMPSGRAALAQAVLLGEAGQLDRVRDLLARPGGLDAGAPHRGEWVAAAYLEAPADPAPADALMEEVRRELGASWFADALVRRLAAGAGERDSEAEAAAAIRARGESLLLRVRALGLAGLGLALLGAFWLLRLARPAAARVGRALVPPSWEAADGWGLFVRAAFAYLTLPVAASFLLSRSRLAGLEQHWLVSVLWGPVLALPMLWWVARHLRRRGQTWGRTFGLGPEPGAGGRVLKAGVALFVLSFVGETVLVAALDAAGVSGHWADGFPETLLWGSPGAVATELLDTVVWAPLFEELVFRGLLFATLRQSLPLWPAALGSGALFAAVHGYGPMGFAAVAWSGTIWAVGYERTGSLLPPMVAHALSNLASGVIFVALLRL